jgi:protein-S-isoprenylcysteine O-methyltransferase Ste14
MTVFILILAIAIWGIVHSILAASGVKDFFRRVFGAGFMKFYRLGYNVFAALSFIPAAYLMFLLPDKPLYAAPMPWSLIMFLGQVAAATLLLVTLLQTDALTFAGIRQLFTEGQPDKLVVGGFYRWMRHPLYTFGLAFIWLTSAMTLNLFVVYLGLTIYIIVGAYFEERKLLREFGEAYAEYKKVTPMLIPGLIFRRNK